ncbi:hypothetical protein Tco_0464112 [Tanacetum coccineum]
MAVTRTTTMGRQAADDYLLESSTGYGRTSSMVRGEVDAPMMEHNGGLVVLFGDVDFEAQKDLIGAMQDFLKRSMIHIPHNEKSIKLLLAEEKFLKIKHFVEEEQTQPEYLQELLQSLLKDLQILNDIQPLRQETPNQIQKDQEEKSIAELLAEERIQKDNQALNENQSPQEMRIQDLEIQKQQCLEEMKMKNDLE